MPHGVGAVVGDGAGVVVTVGRGVGDGGAPSHIEIDTIEPVGGAGVMPGPLTQVPLFGIALPN